MHVIAGNMRYACHGYKGITWIYLARLDIGMVKLFVNDFIFERISAVSSVNTLVSTFPQRANGKSSPVEISAFK